MQSDYMYMNDIIYTINEDIKIVFHVIASFRVNNKVYSNCSEFKIKSEPSCNTMIRRSLSYYLFIDDRRTGKTEKICIYPENMFDLLDMFDRAKKTWFESGSSHIYAYLNNGLYITNEESFVIKLPLDKVIKISPGIFKKESGDCMCLNMYLNTPEPVQISVETFKGMYYVLSSLDMLNYANTSLTFMMLRDTPVNRTDYSSPSETVQTQSIQEDQSKASGSTGRTFNGKLNKSILD